MKLYFGILCCIFLIASLSYRYINVRLKPNPDPVLIPTPTPAPISYKWRDIMANELDLIYNEKVSSTTRCGLHKCPDHATIAQVDGAVITNLNGLVYDKQKRIHALGYWFWKNKKIDVRRPHFDKLKRAFSFIRIWEETFQHSAMSAFPKARYFCNVLADDRDAKIIIENDTQKRVIVAACPEIEHERYYIFRDSKSDLLVDTLFVIHWITSENVNQGELLTLAASPKGIIKLPYVDAPNKLFYMKRERRLGKRYVINDGDVISVLKTFAKHRGLEFVIFDGNVEDLINAAYLIGPHGGAIANLIYTNSKTKVVEFITKKGLIARPCYDLLAQSLSLDYYFVEPFRFNFDSGGMEIHATNIYDKLMAI